MNSRWAVPLLLVAVTAACFLPTLSGEFVNWDDDANFLENPNYRGLSPAHLGWMFTTNHMGNYQPLTWDRKRFPDPARMIVRLSDVTAHASPNRGWNCCTSFGTEVALGARNCGNVAGW